MQIELRREIGLEAMRRVRDAKAQEYENLLRLAKGDEEALYMLSLTLFHRERVGGVIQQIGRFKPHISDIQYLQDTLLSVLSPVAAVIAANGVEEQMRVWQGRIPEIRQIIKETVDYFRPVAVPERVVIVPSDTIKDKTSGSSFVIGKELLISSHTENNNNWLHEFLHSLINPIVYDLLVLSEEQEKQIVVMAENTLQDYGDYPLSLLAEALIRAYNDVVRQGGNSRYHDLLRNSALQFYQEYDRARKEGKISFQDFLLVNISKLIPAQKPL